MLMDHLRNTLCDEHCRQLLVVQVQHNGVVSIGDDSKGCGLGVRRRRSQTRLLNQLDLGVHASLGYGDSESLLPALHSPDMP